MNTEEANDYFKEVSSIMYEHNTEPRKNVQYNTKENNDKKISLSKGRIGQINEKKNLMLKNTTTDSKTKPVTSISEYDFCSFISFETFCGKSTTILEETGEF